LHNQQQWTPNLRQDAVSEFARRLKLRFRPDGPGDPDTAFHAGDLFHYMYALFHSPTYRSRYREALQIDFPRVPITSDRGLFRRMCQWGGQLAALHTFAPPTGSPQAPTFPVSGDNIVAHGYPKYAPPAVPGGRRPADGQGDLEPGRVHINGEQYFEGVEQDVWDFQIGGYRVLSKWLKDRRGRRLERADLDHAARMIVVLSETTRLMREIDSALPKWPW
jgi:hypothetical protein